MTAVKRQDVDRSPLKLPMARCPDCHELGITVFYGDLGVLYVHKCGLARFVAWNDMPRLRQHQFFGTAAEQKEAALSPLQLPTKPTTGGSTPMHARVLLIGHPKVGKTTLAASWAPEKTLILDTHNGTKLLAGEHFVQSIKSYDDFTQTIDALIAGDHQFETVVLDTVDDVYKYADAYAAAKSGKVAAGLVEFGKGTSEAEGVFRRDINKLLATSLGVWFIGHAETEQVDNQLRYTAKLDKRVRTFITGSSDYVWFAERNGPRGRLITEPSGRFEAGSRTPMPSPLDLDARKVWTEMNRGLKQQAMTPAATPDETDNEKMEAAA